MAVNTLLPGTRSRSITPWSSLLTLAATGQGCPGLFGLYDSLGDVTITGTQTFTSLLDGPEVVKRFGALTIGDGTTTTSYTASNRCKGGVILCDTLVVKNAATLNMTGRGARVLIGDDAFFPFVDFKIPFQISLSSSMVSITKALSIIKQYGFAPWDQGTWQCLVSSLLGFNLGVTQAGTVVLLSVTGCGDGANGPFVGNAAGALGITGTAGSNGGMGGGGSGGVYADAGCNSYGVKAGKGSPYSGGSGSGGVRGASVVSVGIPMPTLYSGMGGKGGHSYSQGQTGLVSCDPSAITYYSGNGGAGNPGGKGINAGVFYPAANGQDGTGGKLVIIARTSVTVQSGGKIEANGMPGGNGSINVCGGGGSGGGHISIITPSYTNSGTVQAAGGIGGAEGNNSAGGAGGAGSVVVKTFSDMGW